MLALQRKINGEDVVLNPEDLKIIARQPVDDIFMRVFFRALQSKNVDATAMLLAVLPRIARESELPLIAFSLRFGANPNFYVDVPSRGTMHIIPYVYFLPWDSGTRTTNLRDEIVRLLLLSNSLASKNCFDVNGGSSPSSQKEGDVKESVHEYCQRNYNVDLSIPIVPQKIHAIYLNRTDILTVKLEENDRTDVVRSFCSKDMWDLLPALSKTEVEDPPGMATSVDYYNTELFTELVKGGYLPSYILLTKVVTTLHMSSKHPMIQAELSEMLYHSIEYGAQIDKLQYGYIESSKLVKPEFDRRYNVPYYTKACKADRTMPPTLELRSQFYGLEGTTQASKEVMCRTFEELSKTSPEKAQEVLVEANKEKLNKPSALSLLRGDTKTLQPEEYRRLPDQIVTYRDTNGNLDLYTADRYDDILERGRDTYTEMPVPRDILHEMRQKKDNLTKMGRELFIDPLEMYKLTIPRGLRNIREADKPREDTVPMQYFRSILVENNVSINYWESISEPGLVELLGRVGVKATPKISPTLQRNCVAMSYFTLLSAEKQRLLLQILQREDLTHAAQQ